MTSRRFRIPSMLKWMLLLLLMSASVGSASAFFLWSLDALTRLRFANPWLLAFLPLGGAGVAWLYRRHGRGTDAGNRLLFGEIENGNGSVPRRMAPLALLGTLVTHFFGGSAGREGTALQMGGGIASAFAQAINARPSVTRLLLISGVAAGFGSVFGTPFAGALFAWEIARSKGSSLRVILPCLFASHVAHHACLAWGITHSSYQLKAIEGSLIFHCLLFAKVIVAAVIFGWMAALFSRSCQGVSSVMQHFISQPERRAFVGGCLVIAMCWFAGTSDYLGLGTLASHPSATTLFSAFTDTSIPGNAWLWKLAFTVVTIGAGFKGGEVTPLFFIGATMGNALAGMLHAPVDLFAALGFVAIFAGATHAPMASAVLGLELFGPGPAILVASACFIAHRAAGGHGIYRHR